jgi:hypothetical protein
LDTEGRLAKSPEGVAAVNLPPAIERRCLWMDHRSRCAPLEPTFKHIRSTEMKTLLLAGATLALLTAVNFSPAMAQEPKLSGGNTWAGISQRVDTGSASAAATTSTSTDMTSTEHGGAIGS